MMKKKYIIVTGGVLSGLGKGLAMASIGHLLSSSYKVVPIKCDGYLNVDPGTMNPVEHGEVFVLDDGGEVDMDFGHYERFLGVPCSSDWNLTMGRAFEEIRKKERRGDYLGKTVQMIPHVTGLIKNHFKDVARKSKADIVTIEIGGTVGDMENELFLHAVRDLARDVGNENVLFVHATYVPVPYGVKEQKSKPTQQSVSLLLQKGIQPDIVIARCRDMLTDHIKNKIAIFGNLKKEDIFSAVDVDDIYKIPLVFEKQGMSQLIARKLDIKVTPYVGELRKLIENRENASKEITIVIAGKYTALEDSYASIIESLNHCSASYSAKINVKWIDTTDEENLDSELDSVDGVIIPGGFGSRGTEGKIKVIQKCREQGIPFLGLCYGLQMAVIEFARNVCGFEDSHTTEIKSDTKNPVVDILEEQKSVIDKGGTMRLGSYPAVIKDNTIVRELYNSDRVNERHRHRYEVNPDYHQCLEENGLILSGMSPDGNLVEFVELPLDKHKYFVATQGHPELKSSLFRPAPLFAGLVRAALERKYYQRISDKLNINK